MQTQQIRPKLVLDAAAEAIDFYRTALDAELIACYVSDGKVVFAELEILGCRVTLKDADDADPVGRPGPILDVVVDDPDALAGRLLNAGAREIFAMGDQPWGGRWGRVGDPYGVQWLLQSPGDATPQEIQAVVDQM